MKKIYIFGVGKGKDILKEYLLKENVQILAYVDNYAEKYEGRKIDGEKVIKPQEIDLEFDYIIISLMNYKEIENQLLRMGIDSRCIIKFYSFEDSSTSDYWQVLNRDGWRIELLTHHYKTKMIPYFNNMKYEIAKSVQNGELKIPIVLPAEKAIEKIYKEHVSLARFGDGEFELIQMRDRSHFQTVSVEFSVRLREVLQSNSDKLIIAIADNYGSLEKYTESAANGIRQYLTPSVREEHMVLLDMDRMYYDAYLSRPYIIYKDKKSAKTRFDKLKKIWNKQNILIIEGEASRSGIGNGLFNNAASVQRILAPNKDAYSKYHEIYETACIYGKNKLILISLGAAATILAYDLAMAGYWAVDIGQVDMEYEWFLRGVEVRCDIPYKNISEVKNGDIITELDEELNIQFNSQIVEKI